MIEYGKDAMCDTWHFMGSIFPRAFPQALISSLVALAAISIAENSDVPELQRADSFSSNRETIVELITHPYVHQVSMLSISFVLAFRVSLAYNRYWEGISNVHSMRSKWIDAVSQLIVFDTPPPPAKGERADVLAKRDAEARAFRAYLGHLFSLLHAVAILEIKRCWRTDCLVELSTAPNNRPTWRQMLASMFPNMRAVLIDSERRAAALHVVVLGGLQPEEERQLQAMGTNAWAEVTALRILHVIYDRMRQGGLQIPAPILSRVFQEISTGTLACTSAQKISQIPFPYPFYELMRWVKWYFLISCPLVIVSFTRFWSIAIGASFLSSLLVISLNEVAEELEDPFGEDANDLPLLTIHREFNEVLHRMVSQPKLQLDTPGTESNAGFIENIYNELLVQHRRTMSTELGAGGADSALPSAAAGPKRKPNVRLQPMTVRA